MSANGAVLVEVGNVYGKEPERRMEDARWVHRETGDRFSKRPTTRFNVGWVKLSAVVWTSGGSRMHIPCRGLIGWDFARNRSLRSRPTQGKDAVEGAIGGVKSIEGRQNEEFLLSH